MIVAAMVRVATRVSRMVVGRMVMEAAQLAMKNEETSRTNRKKDQYYKTFFKLNLGMKRLREIRNYFEKEVAVCMNIDTVKPPLKKSIRPSIGGGHSAPLRMDPAKNLMIESMLNKAMIGVALFILGSGTVLHLRSS